MFQGAWLQRQGRGLPAASMQTTLCPTTRGYLLMVASGKGNLQSFVFFSSVKYIKHVYHINHFQVALSTFMLLSHPSPELCSSSPT